MAYDDHVGEEITRYVTQKSYFRPSDNTVRHNAFMPPKNNQLSVYRTTNVEPSEVWAIGDQYVAVLLQQDLIAKAVLNSRIIYDCGLVIEDDPIPHERHANIVGWQTAPTETRLIAMKLAAAATLVRRP
jgi:hypothetical protein